jgi:hypothetical protein
MARRDPVVLDPRIEEGLHGGDWTDDPWFLRVDPVVLTARPTRRPFTKEEIAICHEELLAVYPPDVCRRILARPAPGGTLVIGLFLHHVSYLTPLMEMALNLRASRPVPERMIARLREPTEFAAVCLELDIIAGLRRARVDLDVEPFGPNARGPDLRVRWDYREYYVELKLLRESDTDRLDDEITSDLMMRLVPFFGENGLNVELTGPGRQALRDVDGRERIRAHRDEIIATIAEAARGVHTGERPSGDVQIPWLGTVRVQHTRREEGASVSLFDASTTEDENERIYRAFRDGAQQLPLQGIGIVLVEASRKADLEEAARLLHARMLVSPARFSSACCTVIRTHERSVGGVVVNVPGVPFSPGTQRLAEILVSSR